MATNPPPGGPVTKLLLQRIASQPALKPAPAAAPAAAAPPPVKQQVSAQAPAPAPAAAPKQATPPDNTTEVPQAKKKRGRPRKDAENKAEKEEKNFANFEQGPVDENLTKVGEMPYSFLLCEALNYSNKLKDQKILHTLKVGSEVQLSGSSKESKYTMWFVLAIFRRYNAQLWHILTIRSDATKNVHNLREFPAGWVASIKPSTIEFPAEDVKKIRDDHFAMKCSPPEVKTEEATPTKRAKISGSDKSIRAPQVRHDDLEKYCARLEMCTKEMRPRPCKPRIHSRSSTARSQMLCACAP